MQIWTLAVSEHVAPQRRFRLRQIGGVLGELGRVYKAAWMGTMLWQDAACAARILKEIRSTIEGSELEQRIARLEAQLAPAKPNGSARPGMHP